MPDEFRLTLELSQEYGISPHLALRKIVGMDHATVGAALVEKWNFPRDLGETIRYQHGTDLVTQRDGENDCAMCSTRGTSSWE